MSVVYRKAPVVIIYEQPKLQPLTVQRKKLLPVVLVTIGSILIANISWPILSFLIINSPKLQVQRIVSPLEEERTLKFTPVVEIPEIQPVKQVEAQQEPQTVKEGPEIISEELDYTNLANWFTNVQIPQLTAEEWEKQREYTVDIPALGLMNMRVRIGGTDLSDSLIQYPGTANPGELGAPVIFGHSTNPLFYSPSEKNPKRYTSIFTKLMNLRKDDLIYINYDGIRYTFRVTEKIEVQPDDTFILEQRRDSRELKLITCVPPGTYLRRGVIVARLEDIN